LLVYEPPNAENDLLKPDTHLLFLQPNAPVQRLSFRKFGIPDYYRVVSAARLCADGKPLIYLASGSGATGAGEFFVALIEQSDGLHLFKLPESNQGRIEIFESDPLRVKLWSADGQEEGAFCGACRKHYVVSSFILSDDGFTKTSHRRTQQAISPDPLVDNPLVLRGGQEAPEDGDKSCLSYEPSAVKLTGTLVRETFPGPPEYEDIRHGDRPETSWLIKLSSPVCVEEDKASPALNPGHEAVRTVQLILSPEMYKAHRALVGHSAVATGTLFGEFNGHHHTPVLLIVDRLSAVNGR
jgi:Domain of unknown function (DUF4431)